MNIILIRYNQPEFEAQCIESIKKYTDLNKHTLTIYDNYQRKENLGKLWNELIEESDDENICLLNSDTLVEEGWERLAESLSDPQCGAVGPVTNNCGGTQKNMPKAETIEPINDLSGFCYLFRRKVWRQVGKFPEDMPFYGQETVFNRKLEDHGYKLLVDRRVYVHHFKGQSWLKAKAAGEVTMAEAEYGAFHYRNFIRRLKELRDIIPQGTRIVFLGSEYSNPFPTFRGIDQTISDFFGLNAVHLPMESQAETILAFQPQIMIVVNTRYKPEWYEQIRKVKKQGVKTALYWMDLRSPSHTKYETGFTFSLTPYFDRIFMCAKWFINDWNTTFKVQTEWLPQATLQHPIPPKDPESPKVIHIGDIRNSKYHQDRQGVVNQLADSFIPVKQLNETIREKRAQLSKRSYGLYGSADFSLSISPLIEGYTSDRTYHILGAGGVLLMLDPLGLDHLKPYGFIEKDIATLIKRIKETDGQQITELKRKAFEYAQAHELYKDRYIHILKRLCA